MDTCFVLTPIRIEHADSFLEQALAFLRQSFSFSRHTNDALEDTASKARTRLSIVETAPTTGPESPYDWLRLSGTVSIGKRKHDLNIFIYPIAAREAAVSLCFSSSLYDTVSGLETGFDEDIDEDAKKSLLALFAGVTEISGVDGFAFGMVRSDQDMIPAIRTKDLKHWLEQPDRELIAQNPYFLVGIRNDQIDRGVAECNWPAKRLSLSQSDFLTFDGIGSVE